MVNSFSFTQSSTPYLAGLFASALLHTGLVLLPLPNFSLQSENDLEEAIEVVIEAAAKPTEVITPEPKIEPKPLPDQATAPELVAEITALREEPQKVAPKPLPKVIALAPNSSKSPQSIAKDAPAADQIIPTPSPNGDLPMPAAIGKVIQENARGWGFGLNQLPSGFENGDLKGNLEGDPKGQVEGAVQGQSQEKSEGKESPVSPVSALEPPTQPPVRPKLECISCPKPQYRGKEGTPRVTYDITPDGRVINVRLRQSSGDPDTDRETLEAMSKWQFNPKTVPEGGRTDVKVRITFEESGSQFQRQNEERRRERERIAQEQREREAARLAESEQQQRLTRKQEPRSPEPKPAYVPTEPVYTPPPTPAYVSPAPVFTPPPEPAYVSPEPVFTPPPEYTPSAQDPD